MKRIKTGDKIYLLREMRKMRGTKINSIIKTHKDVIRFVIMLICLLLSFYNLSVIINNEECMTFYNFLILVLCAFVGSEIYIK